MNKDSSMSLLFIANNYLSNTLDSVADPGFPIGGAPSRWGGGAPTSDVGAFRQKCM